MPGGKAHGVDRDYQVSCRDILISRAAPLQVAPEDGDGVDVGFRLESVVRTFDVALTDDHNKLVVAECRRTVAPVKIVDIDAFAQRVELLRKATGREVAGVFFAKTAFQEGAVKAAQDSGIAAATCAQDQPPSSFSILFHRYDPERERRFRHGEAYAQDSVAVVPTLDVKVIRADGTVDDHGRVG